MFTFVPRRALRAAGQLARHGRLADAEQLYRRVLQAVPNDAIAEHNLAVVLFAKGETYDAHKLLRDALQHDSFRPAFFVTMAEMLEHPQLVEHFRKPFHGPFNGQQVRQQIFLQMVEAAQPRAIFETGTYRGTTTDFMARSSKAHVFTCELEPNFFRFAADRFRDTPNVTVVNLDSRSFLERYVPRFARPGEPSLFYLDAHWDKDDLPLLTELRIVFEQAPRAIVMIDDFEVWDDAGYIFDDYGAAGKVSLEYLAPLDTYKPRYFFPIGSSNETGMVRGSVVVTIDDALAARLARIPQLRPAPPPPQKP